MNTEYVVVLLSGVILGFCFLIFFSLMYKPSGNVEKKEQKIIKKFLNVPWWEIEFKLRYGDRVELMHQSKDFTFILDLKKELVNVKLSGHTITGYNWERNKTLLRLLYNRILKDRKKEIFQDVFNYNEVLVSKNFFNEDSKEKVYDIKKPDLDDLLDKISKSGIDSLSKEELEILKKFDK